MQLGGFTQKEVGEFVEASTGVTLSQEARDLLHGRTEGNPLFVGEVTHQIGAEDLTTEGTWANTIPEGIRDAITVGSNGSLAYQEARADPHQRDPPSIGGDAKKNS